MCLHLPVPARSSSDVILHKSKRFGIKLFVLCDCKSSVILDFIVYAGRDTNIDRSDEDVGISGHVIQTLLRPYLSQNHIIYMDNWYSSPKLFSWLFDNGTGACGTVRASRRGLPCLPNKIQKGETVVRHNDKMLAVRWCDRRNVTMLSTIHDHTMIDVTKNSETVKKPVSVTEYTKNMGAIDKSDMITSFNDSTRKTTKWYRKLFFHILDITMLNCHYMLNIKRGKKQKFSEFRVNLVRQVLETHYTPKDKQPAIPRSLTGDKHPLRLTERHFIKSLPGNQERKRKIQRQCYVCANSSRNPKKRKDTSYECPDCRVALCIEPCFELFHTIKKY